MLLTEIFIPFEIAAQVVVDFTGNAGAFLLLDPFHVRRQFFQLAP